MAQACKSESFIYPFVCQANQGRDIAPLSENRSLNEKVNKLTQEKVPANCKPSLKPNENDLLIKMSNEIIELRKEVNSLSEVNREITYQLAELQDSYNKQVELNKSLEKKITSQCESVDNLITSNDNKPVPSQENHLKIPTPTMKTNRRNYVSLGTH